ncbi:tRNA (adenosine(37)-N6)-threonylcarbamoyltransferase complex dimerization subunit type 1 TsaB [Aquibaculum arenosum]|uniref:tRNA (Adenosine(37)-N6)-threonylcarbamoyltransferase complex dimerization subunit type 1 TsaB n=1 Tax=Aquibaculum arenosum TaxID=3032591 RepID=A0ABT5YKJ9_9PROT|nr:tRNA (adenosine(37)-N6)-threonylcarbamoyltransferase complex dimerization subunit type 1 TsaB [Fodinicurvata sp. CAU 1616]MDF2095481.1 tRNA (adenosine(37)-N6)-threonylcarbamoyltransferase complex dimerization subunit type 1 TsaB [Fodinicurvata sp. CAU 1616]
MPNAPFTPSPVLAFDCAGSSCSAAILVGDQVLAQRFEARRRGQAERLLPLLQECLAEAGLSWTDLGRLAVTRGPGSFTGVRVGLATARALALASGLPLFAVDGFRLYAAMTTHSLPEATRRNSALVVAIDARRADLFLQCFDAQGQPLAEPQSLLPEQAAARLPAGPLLLAGDGVEQLLPALTGRDYQVVEGSAAADSVALARLAANLPLPPAGSLPPTPLYLRPPDVSLPGKPRA